MTCSKNEGGCNLNPSLSSRSGCLYPPPSQAIDSIHGVGVFCLALVPANTLPKTPLGGIHLSEIKQLYLEGGLHPCNVLMCPHTCVTNLPKPRQKQPGETPTADLLLTGCLGWKLSVL